MVSRIIYSNHLHLIFNIFSNSRVNDTDKIVTNIDKQEETEEDLGRLGDRQKSSSISPNPSPRTSVEESNKMILPNNSSLNTSRAAPVAKIRQFIGIDDIPHVDVAQNVSNQMKIDPKDTSIKTGNIKFNDEFHYSITMNHTSITSTHPLPTFTITCLHQT